MRPRSECPSDVLCALPSRQRRLHAALSHFSEEFAPKRKPDPPRERSRQQLRLVVAAPAHFLRMHRHRYHAIEVVVVPSPKRLGKKLPQRLAEKIVPLELEGVKESLDAAPILSPRRDPIEL